MTEKATNNVKVMIRIKPLSKQDNQCSTLKYNKESNILILNASAKYKEQTYAFDQVWTEDISQIQIYQYLNQELIQNFIEGYNVCLLAYGQTGSGKTYTLQGPPLFKDFTQDNMGVIPRLFQTLFEQLKQQCSTYRLVLSYFEIYNENLKDLLNPEAKPNYKALGQYIQFTNLSEIELHSTQDAYAQYKIAIGNRSMSATECNETSSRSHSICMLQLESTVVKNSITTTIRSSMNIVDLAGSERQEKTGTIGANLKEACKINQSLSVLSRVVKALMINNDSTKPRQHVPFRESVLTTVLMNTLSGNSKTLMIANISASELSYNETKSTLEFANSAKQLINKPKVGIQLNELGEMKLLYIKSQQYVQIYKALLMSALQYQGKVADEEINRILDLHNAKQDLKIREEIDQCRKADINAIEELELTEKSEGIQLLNDSDEIVMTNAFRVIELQEENEKLRMEIESIHNQTVKSPVKENKFAATNLVRSCKLISKEESLLKFLNSYSQPTKKYIYLNSDESTQYEINLENDVDMMESTTKHVQSNIKETAKKCNTPTIKINNYDAIDIEAINTNWQTQINQYQRKIDILNEKIDKLHCLVNHHMIMQNASESDSQMDKQCQKLDYALAMFNQLIIEHQEKVIQIENFKLNTISLENAIKNLEIQKESLEEKIHSMKVQYDETKQITNHKIEKFEKTLDSNKLQFQTFEKDKNTMDKAFNKTKLKIEQNSNISNMKKDALYDVFTILNAQKKAAYEIIQSAKHNIQEATNPTGSEYSLINVLIDAIKQQNRNNKLNNQ